MTLAANENVEISLGVDAELARSAVLDGVVAVQQIEVGQRLGVAEDALQRADRAVGRCFGDARQR